jgi:thymidylate synthase
MKTIEESSVFRAWLAGAKHLQSQDDWEDFNLVLSISDPRSYQDGDKKIECAVDALLKGHNNSLHTVAETIFPLWLYKKEGTAGVYKTYPDKVFPLIKKDTGNRWGTYAYRMVRRTGKKEETFNPLEELVNRMKAQIKQGKQKARFELSLTEEIPIYSDKEDKGWPIGGPCLSHLSFKLDHKNKKVHLAVMYRSHYYVEKTLGNLVGIARLQAFVAEQVKFSIGELVCVSTFAKLDYNEGRKSNWKKADVNGLLNGLKL